LRTTSAALVSVVIDFCRCFVCIVFLSAVPAWRRVPCRVQAFVGLKRWRGLYNVKISLPERVAVRACFSLWLMSRVGRGFGLLEFVEEEAGYGAEGIVAESVAG